jgi:transposase
LWRAHVIETCLGLTSLRPSSGRRGDPEKYHRAIITGVLWTLSQGAPSRDLPECYGLGQTCHHCLVLW